MLLAHVSVYGKETKNPTFTSTTAYASDKTNKRSKRTVKIQTALVLSGATNNVPDFCANKIADNKKLVKKKALRKQSKTDKFYEANAF